MVFSKRSQARPINSTKTNRKRTTKANSYHNQRVGVVCQQRMVATDEGGVKFFHANWNRLPIWRKQKTQRQAYIFFYGFPTLTFYFKNVKSIQ